MSIVKFPSIAGGVSRDATPEELPLGTWSDVQNMSFKGGYMSRSAGMDKIFATPSVVPYWVSAFRTSSALYWVHVGLTSVYVDDGTTRTNITGTALAGSAGTRITGGAFNGTLVFNNGVDVPRYWTGSTAANTANLTAWPAGYKCQALRPFKNYLFALDVTKAGTRYPYRVLWSALADPGTVPTSWDITDPTKDAGEVDLAETTDILVDALPLGDSLIIYKSASMYACRYVGGQSIFAFNRVPGDVGMLTKGCAVNTPKGHVVLTTGDVVIHQGQGPASIADSVVRKAIFDEMDSTYAERSAFVTINPPQNEVWVCYPTDGNVTCTKAAVWNWQDNTWSFRTLRNVTSGAVGQTPSGASGTTYAATTDIYSTTTLTYGGKASAPNDQHLVLASTAPALALVGSGNQDIGVAFSSYATRTGMALDDPQTLKLARTVWPRIDAVPGTVVNISVGASMTPDVAPTWQTAVPFTVGTSTKVDSFAKGRFLALKFASTTDADWRLRGLEMDVVPQGRW